jgi:TolB-like protein/Flp pilus assembly protein TadD
VVDREAGRSFFAELKRRNVLRVGAFYAGAAWLLVQVATQVFPFFDVPNPVVRVIVLLCLVGAPFALVFAWFWELTPQGLKRESEIAADATIQRSSGKRLDRAIIAVLGLALTVAIGLLLFERFHSIASPPQTAPPGVADLSIAVLPFASLSDDKSNEYFAIGIQDEVLTRLSNIGSMKVISRTSTARYASSPDNLPAIAHQLGVAHIVEGSVQKVGNAVRINVQLIRAADDTHLWARIYDRQLDDIFSVQGEVAQDIAQALQARLSGGEREALMQTSTRNVAAYDAYLRGLAIEARAYQSATDYRRAAEQYEQAVALDPDFADGWTHLVSMRSFMLFNRFNEGGGGSLAQLKQAVDEVKRLRPGSGQAWLAEGYYQYRGLIELPAALQAFQQAAALLPNNSEVWGGLAYVQRRLGRFDEALANMRKAESLDPRSVNWPSGVAELLYATHRYADALSAYDRALSLRPDDSGLIANKAAVYLDMEQFDQADRVIASIPAAAALDAAIARSQLLSWRQDYAAAARVMRELPDNRDGPDRPLQVGQDLVSALLWADMEAFAGHRDVAERIYRQMLLAVDAALQPGMLASVNDEPLLRNMRARAQLGLGNRDAALREIDRVIELVRNDSKELPGARMMIAVIDAHFGDAAHVVEVLTPQLGVPYGPSLSELKHSPYFQAVRDDPRYRQLLAEAARRMPSVPD